MDGQGCSAQKPADTPCPVPTSLLHTSLHDLHLCLTHALYQSPQQASAQPTDQPLAATATRPQGSMGTSAADDSQPSLSASHPNGTAHPTERNAGDIPVPAQPSGLDRYRSPAYKPDVSSEDEDQEPPHDGTVGAKATLFRPASVDPHEGRQPQRELERHLRNDNDNDEEEDGEDESHDHAGTVASSHPATHSQSHRGERHGKNGCPEVVVRKAKAGFGGVPYTSGSSNDNDGSSTSSRSSDCQQVNQSGRAIKPTAGSASKKRKTASQARHQSDSDDEDEDEEKDITKLPPPLRQSKTRGKAPLAAPSGTAGRRVSSRINDAQLEVGACVAERTTLAAKHGSRLICPVLALPTGATFASPFKLVQAAAALIMQGNQHLAYVSSVGGADKITIRCNNSRPKATRDADLVDPRKGQPFTQVTDCTFQIRASVPKKGNKKRMW